MRIDKRKNDELRQVTMTRNYIDSAPGSVLVEFGKTKVVCTAMIEDKVPLFLKEKRQGWITAEYGMLPGATQDRMTREATRGKQSGRTMEIQRLVGRSLRAVVDLKGLGSRTIRIDCDVIQADGGTRTSAVTGSMVALYDAVQTLLEDKKIKAVPITYFIAAVSVGIVRGSVMLDLCYEEDSSADVDMNVVMTDKGCFVELQGTAEQKPFEPAELAKMIDVGKKGIKQLIAIQKKVLKIK